MFDPAVFAARREAYMKAIGPTSVAGVRSLPERLRYGDAFFMFRQLSDVQYLTGFAEPDTTLILRPGAETDRGVMFVRPSDPEMETWEGKRAGIDGAKKMYGADAANPAAELPGKLADLIANHEELHYALGLDDEMDKLVTSAIARLRKLEKRGMRPPHAVVDPRDALHEQRLHKRPEELASLKKAVAISVEAHVAAMRAGRPGVFEYELEALIDYTFRRRGGQGPGYTSIVGAGENATILHYIDNRCAIADGDLTLDEIHNHCVRRLTEGMIALGLLGGTADERIADHSYRKFYMHGTSHWLGIDVHDVGAYIRDGKARPLEAGMVLTVAPGLYIAPDADAPGELRGIGIRIEDDVLVTEAGHEVLTAACPKKIEDIEAAIRG